MNSDKRLEAFLLNATLAAGMLTLALAVARFLVQGWPNAVGTVLLASSATFFVEHGALRWIKLLSFTKWAMPLTGLVGISCMSLVESGLGSEALFWLPSVPLIAVISLGRSGVLLCTGLATLWVLVILGLGDDVSTTNIFQAVGLVGAVGFGGIVGLSYEASRRTEDSRLRDALRLSEEASEAKSNFLASMSHELRTPLNAIIGFSKLLMRGKSAPADSAESYEERIFRNGSHLLRLINDVLDVSKIEAGELEVATSSFEVAALVRECLVDVESLCLSNKIDVSFNDAAIPVFASGDPIRTKQVIFNLLSNAIKFNKDGGKIRIVLLGNDEGKALRLDVVDTGPGFSKEQAREVFMLFRQLEQSTARIHDGTGLGLALSRRFCALMGFRLEVVAVVGEGASFSLYFSDDAPVLDAHEPISA